MFVVVGEMKAFDGDIHLTTNFKTICFNFKKLSMIMNDVEMMDEREGRGERNGDEGKKEEKRGSEKSGNHATDRKEHSQPTLLLRTGLDVWAKVCV
jgi:hypothetical protein